MVAVGQQALEGLGLLCQLVTVVTLNRDRNSPGAVVRVLNTMAAQEAAQVTTAAAAVRLAAATMAAQQAAVRDIKQTVPQL
jgi:hypothetical protein